MDSLTLELTAKVASAYLSNNSVPQADVPNVLRSIGSTFSMIAANGSGDAVGTSAKPAVPVKKSVTPEHIICLEDGKKLKMLKRYLRSRYDLSPDQYRTKWGLPRDYPMTAPNYSAKRSQFAKDIGLGTTPKKAKSKR